MEWFDGHLDLTYLALHGRDLMQEVERCGGTLLPASVTFPALRAAGVRRAVSTLFVRKETESVRGPYCFRTEEEAHVAGVFQVRMHRGWEKLGAICIGAGEGPGGGLRTVLALEGAACLRGVEDLDSFYGAGVRVMSLAWAEGSKYAGGDQSGGDVTEAGRELVARADALGVVHDVSHLSERAFWTLMEAAKGRVIASHSNCRALLAGAKYPERHLSDEQIKAIVGRGGVVGVNLFARFLVPAEELERRQATVGDVVRHVEHIAEVAGRRGCVALGSDMDSGFGTELLPEDLEGPGYLGRLAEGLAGAGWSDREIEGFAAGVWEGLFSGVKG